MITQVSLKNWRSHEDSTLDFGQGTNILIGMMGGGKSSIIDAICFALFGDFPSHRQKKLDLDDIILNNANEREAQVEVHFISNGTEYVIKRTIRPNGTEAEIRKNDKLIDGPQPKRVNEYIQNLLKVDYDLFTRAIYSEQNSIDYFLTIGKGDRKKQMDELLGINKFERARSSLSSIITSLRNTMREKELFIKGIELKKLEEAISSTKNELARLNDENSTISKQITVIEASSASIEKDVSLLVSKKATYNMLEKEKAALEHREKSLTSALQGKAYAKEEIANGEQKLREISGTCAKLQSEVKEIDSKLSELNRELGTLTRKKEETEKKLHEKQLLEREKNTIGKPLLELQKDLNVKKELLDSLKSKINYNESHAKELKLLIDELTKELSSCPICESKLTALQRLKLKEKREQEHTECLKLEKNLHGELKREKESLAAIEKLLKHMEKIENDLLRLTATAIDLDEITSRISAVSKSTQEMGENKNLVHGQIKSIEKDEKELKDLLAGMKELSHLSERLLILQKSTTELNFSEQQLDEKKSSLEKLRIDLSSLKVRLSGIKNTIEKTNQILALNEEQFKKCANYELDLKKTRQLIENLMVFQNTIVETQIALREELIGAINEEMSSIWHVIYPYSDFKAARLRTNEDDYSLELLSDAWHSVDGRASGGERACACLALRIAFARVLAPNLSWLILDEPTHNLDEEAVKGLARALYEDIPKIVDQTFVITHDENLKDVGNAHIYRVERDKEKNEPSKVEPML